MRTTKLNLERRATKSGNIALIPLGKKAKDGFTIVDPEDRWLDIYSWSVNKGYANTSIKGKTVRMHQLLLDAPQGHEVDHKNHNKLDNRRSNLRVATRSNNQSNTAIQINNTSGYKGVSWAKNNKKYIAQLVHNRKHYNLGFYETPEAAAKAYDSKARELFGDFAHTNFPYIISDLD